MEIQFRYNNRHQQNPDPKRFTVGYSLLLDLHHLSAANSAVDLVVGCPTLLEHTIALALMD